MLLAGALAGRAAAAGEAIELSWNDCRLGGGTSDLSPPCSNALFSQALVTSFSLGQPVDSVVSAEIVVDVQSADGTLPAWWQFQPGACDDGMLTSSTDFSALTGCADAWNRQASSLVQEILPGEPRGAPSQVRFVVTAFVPGIQARSLSTGLVYDAAVLLFDFFRASRCAGCTTPACLVLNSIRLRRLPGAADVLLVTPGDNSGNRATWNSGTGADCLAVPVKARTWGQIKSLYR